MTREVIVYTPDNPDFPKPIRNPLYSYTFPRSSLSAKSVPKYTFDDKAPFYWTRFWLKYNEFSKNNKDITISNRPNQNTVRCPGRSDVTNHRNLMTKLHKDVVQIGEKMYKLLTEDKPYDAFATNFNYKDDNPLSVGDRKWKNDNSLEAIHNGIHTAIGRGLGDQGKDYPGDGIMAEPAWSAFDPIFWLHHCNFDRLFALWQSQNPGKTDFSQKAGEDTFWSRTTDLTQDTPLIPFLHPVAGRPGRQSFWTSKECQYWKILGYDYPEFRSTRSVRDTINLMYRWTTPTHPTQPAPRSETGYPKDLTGVPALSEGTIFMDGGSEMEKRDFNEVPAIKAAPVVPIGPRPLMHMLANGAVPATLSPARSIVAEAQAVPGEAGARPLVENDWSHLEHLAVNQKLREWDGFVRHEKYGLNGNVSVVLFLGPLDPTSIDWSLQPGYAGHTFSFTNSMTDACENCKVQSASGLLISDMIPLTTRLMEWMTAKRSPRLRSLDTEDVVPFLKANLRWKVYDSTGAQRDAQDLPSLEVAVAERLVGLPRYEHEDLIYEDYTHQAEATEGKEGGLGRTSAS